MITNIPRPKVNSTSDRVESIEQKTSLILSFKKTNEEAPFNPCVEISKAGRVFKISYRNEDGELCFGAYISNTGRKFVFNTNLVAEYAEKCKYPSETSIEEPGVVTLRPIGVASPVKIAMECDTGAITVANHKIDLQTMTIR